MTGIGNKGTLLEHGIVAPKRNNCVYFNSQQGIYLPSFVKKFSVESLINVDQHFICDGDAGKVVKVRHNSLRIRDEILILDTLVPVSRKGSAVLKIT